MQTRKKNFFIGVTFKLNTLEGIEMEDVIQTNPAAKSKLRTCRQCCLNVGTLAQALASISGSTWQIKGIYIPPFCHVA